jgi:membrane protein implicated in regulation of membrane protease activity
MRGRRRTLLQVLSETLFLLILGVVAMFAFFVALGALKPGEVVGLSVAVLALAAIWVAHAVWVSRHSDGRDPATIRARERRGF